MSSTTHYEQFGSLTVSVSNAISGWNWSIGPLAGCEPVSEFDAAMAFAMSAAVDYLNRDDLTIADLCAKHKAAQTRLQG